jgi:hypothetical protein
MQVRSQAKEAMLLILQELPEAGSFLAHRFPTVFDGLTWRFTFTSVMLRVVVEWCVESP